VIDGRWLVSTVVLALAVLWSGDLRAQQARPLPGPVVAQAGSDSQRLAAVLARLQQLEEEVRQLRGRLEELEYVERQNAERMDNLVAGVDARLSEFEERGRGTIPPAAPDARRTEPPTVTRGGAPTAQTDTRSQILGTIPRDALIGTDRSSRAAPASPPRAPDPGNAAQLARATSGSDAGQRYDASMALLRSSDWASAQRALEAFVQDFPEDGRAPTAAYWLGETYYVQQDYASAAATFAKNYRVYGPESAKAPDTLLKLGMSLAKLGDPERACQTFEELSKRHSDAPAAVRQALSRERAAIGCG
jgi:tol-pal system protein YbgF